MKNTHGQGEIERQIKAARSTVITYAGANIQLLTFEEAAFRKFITAQIQAAEARGRS